MTTTELTPEQTGHLRHVANLLAPALTEVDPGVDVAMAHYDRTAGELNFSVAGENQAVIGNLGRAGLVVREGDTVIGRRAGELRSEHPGLRANAEGLELAIRDDRPRRYTVTLGGNG